MVPSAFVVLPALPLTASGKLDRARLPAPTETDLPLAERYQAPRTPIEALLADTWAEVLGVTQVGVDDNFFTLGGHSLLAIQVIARIQDTIHIDLPLRCLFETPTIAGLAETIAHDQLEQANREELGQLLELLEQMSEDDASGELINTL